MNKLTKYPEQYTADARYIRKSWNYEEVDRERWAVRTLARSARMLKVRNSINSDTEFGWWLKDNDINMNRDTVAAHLGMARNPELALEVLSKTDRRSIRYIWLEEMKPFLPKPKPQQPKDVSPLATPTIPIPLKSLPNPDNPTPRQDEPRPAPPPTQAEKNQVLLNTFKKRIAINLNNCDWELNKFMDWPTHKALSAEDQEDVLRTVADAIAYCERWQTRLRQHFKKEN